MIRRMLACFCLCTLMLSTGVAYADVPTAAEPDTERTKTDDAAEDRAAVLQALQELGLSDGEIADRLDRMNPEDVRYFADNPDQVQAAGDVPRYIWILLGVLLAVTVLSAL